MKKKLFPELPPFAQELLSDHKACVQELNELSEGVSCWTAKPSGELAWKKTRSGAQ